MSCLYPMVRIEFRDAAALVRPLLRVAGDVDLRRLLWLHPFREVSCGTCEVCRMRAAAIWGQRCLHEHASRDFGPACFLTLTYAPEFLPVGGNLRKSDFQLFMKRVRKAFGHRSIAVFWCGEFGPKNERPHYHAILFGIDFPRDRLARGLSDAQLPHYESDLLSRLWGMGWATTSPVNAATIAYTVGYNLKPHDVVDTATGELVTDPLRRTLDKRLRPFHHQSNRPAIGDRWATDHLEEIYPADVLRLADGREFAPFEHYDRVCERERPDLWARVSAARAERAAAHVHEFRRVLEADPRLEALEDELSRRRLQLEAAASARGPLRTRA